jgi:hypothetical protein
MRAGFCGFLAWGSDAFSANARVDEVALAEVAAVAVRIPIRTRTRLYALEQANEALLDLKEDRVQGAADWPSRNAPPAPWLDGGRGAVQSYIYDERTVRR